MQKIVWSIISSLVYGNKPPVPWQLTHFATPVLTQDWYHNYRGSVGAIFSFTDFSFFLTIFWVVEEKWGPITTPSTSERTVCDEFESKYLLCLQLLHRLEVRWTLLVQTKLFLRMNTMKRMYFRLLAVQSAEGIKCLETLHNRQYSVYVFECQHFLNVIWNNPSY